MSREIVRIPRGVTGFRTGASAVQEAQPAGAACATTAQGFTAAAVRALQTEAEQRGRELERMEATATIRQAAAALTATAASLKEMHAREQEAAEAFACRLAVTAIHELTGAVLQRDGHDVRALVRRILEDALGGHEEGEVTLEGHPDDLARLEGNLAGSVRLQPEADLAKGSFRVHAEGAEYFSCVTQRLKVLEERLLREVSHGA